jgi:hypothetical protein
MNIREALITQAPSLALQRAAQSEIARLDAILEQRNNSLALMTVQLEEARQQLAQPKEQTNG